jgi:hypothetical protein
LIRTWGGSPAVTTGVRPAGFDTRLVDWKPVSWGSATLLLKLRLDICLLLHGGPAFHVLPCSSAYYLVKTSGKLQLTGLCVILGLEVADWALRAIFALKGGRLVDINRQMSRKRSKPMK